MLRYYLFRDGLTSKIILLKSSMNICVCFAWIFIILEEIF